MNRTGPDFKAVQSRKLISMYQASSQDGGAALRLMCQAVAAKAPADAMRDASTVDVGIFTGGLIVVA